MSYQIHADHGYGRTSIETGGRYVSAFEGRCGDGWVLSVNRSSHQGTIMGNDIPEPSPVSADDPIGLLVMDQSEKVWIISCWMSILRESFEQIEHRIHQAAESRAYANMVQEQLEG